MCETLPSKQTKELDQTESFILITDAVTILHRHHTVIMMGADSERNGGSSDDKERLSTAGSNSVAGSDVSADADHEEVVCLVLVASVLQSGGFYSLCVYCGFVWICDLMVLLTDCTR